MTRSPRAAVASVARGAAAVRTSSNLAAGLVDAAAAAGSTFLGGLTAIRNLDGDVLALYVLLFSATLVAMTLPRQLVYIPSELKSNLQPTVVSPVVVRDALRASPFDAITALIVAVSGVSLLGRVPMTSFLALMLTAAAFAVVSPLQDHVRSALHLVDRHWSAATCSVVVLAVVGSVAGAALVVRPEAGAELLPFGSLFAGNALSVGVGAVLLRGAARYRDYRQDPLRVRSRFLFAEIAVQAAWFGCNLAVLWILNAKAVGDLEAARVVASPLNIVIVGLLSFMNPRLLRALSAGREEAGGLRTRLVRLFGTVIAASGVYYLAVVLLVGVVTAVFDRTTDLALVGARLGAVLVEGLSVVIVQLIFAMGRSRRALGLSVTAAAIGLAATTALLPFLGEFALPAGQAIGMLFRLAAALVLVERDLRGRDSAPPDRLGRPAVDEELTRRTIEEEATR